MKINKSQLLQIIKEEIANETALVDPTPVPHEGGTTQKNTPANQLTSVIAGLAMLIADTRIPTDKISKLTRMREDLIGIESSIKNIK